MSSEGLWYLFAAYGAFWILLAGFLIRLGRRHRELERALEALERRLTGDATP